MLEALLFGLATIVLGIILMGIGFFGSDMGMAFTDAFNFIVSLKWLTVPLAGILTVVLWAVILFLICLPQLVLAGWKTKRYAEKAPEHLKREMFLTAVECAVVQAIDVYVLDYEVPTIVLGVIVCVFSVMYLWLKANDAWLGSQREPQKNAPEQPELKQ